MSDVIQLDDHRYNPHVTMDDCDGNVHVIPVSLLEDIASGKARINELEAPEFLSTIVQLYLDNVVYVE